MKEELFEVVVKARMYHGILKRIVDDNGGCDALANIIGVSDGTVRAWLRMDCTPLRKNRRKITQRTLRAVKKLCQLGQCKASDLWPDWFDGILPLKKEITFSQSVEPARLLGMNRVPLAALPAPIDDSEERQHVDDSVNQLLAVLPQRLQNLVRLRHFEERTYGQIGKSMGISGERVCQLHARALQKMKNAGIKKSESL